jgi:tetratricopeptide (TPR) repeat protein
MSLAASTVLPAVHWRARESVRTTLSLAKLLPILRAGVAASPDRADLKLQLAKALFDGNHMAEIVDRLKPAAADDTADPALLYYLGRAALATRDLNLAVDALRAAAGKGFEAAFTYLAQALLQLNRVDEAVEAGLQGTQSASSDFKSLTIVARILLKRGQAERLWGLCADLRARGAWGGYLPAVMAFAAAVLGHENEVAALVDRAKWFSASRLTPRVDLNGRLAAELLAHKSLAAPPPKYATRGAGAWIGQLELAGGPLAQELLARIRGEVEAYVAKRQAFADHPIMVRRHEFADLKAWAVELHHDGHQTPHIHPGGWISGVYYVEVPNVQANPDGNAGAIEFGPLFFGLGDDNVRFPRWRVKPEPGLLLLFPSYYAHRTLPTGVSAQRISVAFDVIPSAPAGAQA